ncbi:YgaP family membrane protein [Aestuariirhabdus litorea]|uniref:DUF2892 domain-containing protein n=1 Tax=Aestuariirhabdus litorea TaxID=2528527 RepID=A0A3P3VQX7_9GAMM|nr:DUF2892 domain-containing protein [Aestuariirhabdus litorea]RRJ84717.1 DUF2892 domain-containing protein [Aestuariirhabdus litorea]RWW97942.1 DUF2892 domain-containing protein [Endozoicomonadaceae bacterium GTF-13]
MNINEYLRLIAGTVVIASTLAAVYVDPMWLWLTGFVGLNLFQSAFTKWCPMITLLRRLGVNE